MRRIAVAAVVVLLGATAARAELQLKDVQVAHGVLGPERKSLAAYPYDEIVLRFVVAGAKVDDKGHIDATLGLRLTDATGKVLLDREEPLKGALALGGTSYGGNSRVEFGAKPPVGGFTLIVTVTDNLSKESATVRKKFTTKDPDFVILAPRFFYDQDGKVPAPPGGLVGQSLFFRLRAIGHDRSQDKIEIDMEVDLLDENGKSVLPKPMTGSLRSDKEEEVKKAEVVNFNGNLGLNRPGTFTLRVTLTDKLGKKEAKFETPLKVAAP